MKKITINIKENKKQYPILIGENILGKIRNLIDLRKYSQAAIITDKNIEKYWLKDLENALSIPYIRIIIPAGEKEKNIQTVQYIWKKMVEGKLDRKSLVINLGGGVIGDTGGFAASTYMRGIDFVQIPTSLTAQVDAMVGGKVGINFENVKNYIGSYQQPIAVLIDIKTLQTLPRRVHEEAFGEIMKHGLIADKKYFEFVTSKKPGKFSQSEMIEIITRSIEIKAHVVENDEKEDGQRKILNFGHTIGHAIESLSFETDQPLMHGEAVLIGMIAETKISELAGLLSKKESARIKDTLLQTGLPVKVENSTIENVLEKIQTDKKNQYGKTYWTLLDKIGHAVINQKVDTAKVIQGLKEIL